MMNWPARIVRTLRCKWLGWSRSRDREFHDAYFSAPTHDPFSPAYPGSITIRRFADLAEVHARGAREVLDLGCGPGEITCELARRLPGTRLVGIDHSQTAITLASAHASRLGLSNVTFAVADVGSFVPEHPVDLAMMFDAFHHLTEPREFVRRMQGVCREFFLIEPAGDVVGRWRHSFDFDWVAIELDKVRARLDEAFGSEAHAPPPPGALPSRGAAGEPVEFRYTLDDFERFFDGFRLDVRGTVAGLTSYPPEASAVTAWREEFGELAYRLFGCLDDRLLEAHRDLWARHWAIHAVRGSRAPRRAMGQGPGDAPASIVAGPYDVAYERYEGATSVPAGAVFLAEVGVRNTGSSSWASSGANPVFVSYRWLTASGVEVTADQPRFPFPRVVAPGDSCRVPIRVTAPPHPGRWTLAIDLVKEGVTWFSEAGQSPLRVTVRTTRRRAT